MKRKNQKTTKTILYIRLIAVIFLVPFGMTNALAQELSDDFPEESETDVFYTIYEKDDILHTFIVMEPYAIYDEDMHLSFSTDAINDPLVRELDIQIASDFIVHHNEIYDAHVGPVAVVDETAIDMNQLEIAVNDFVEGQFQKLFDKEYAKSPVARVTYMDYVPIVNTFGITQTSHSIWHLEYCGGGFDNPHPVYRENRMPLNPVDDLEQAFRDIGFTQIYFWDDNSLERASNSVDVQECRTGSFRDQVDLGVSDYVWQPDEPTVLRDYSPPTVWWVAYVGWWHLDHNNNPDNIDDIPDRFQQPL